MNIRLAQLNPIIGDLSGNKALIIKAIEQAEQQGVDLLILPELVVCGYPPLDLIERSAFRELCYSTNIELIERTKGMAVVFGSITENDKGVGRKCYNSAIIAQNGKEIKRAHKALLPTYDVFDDLRYFEPATELEPVTINGVSFGVTICEDIWANNNEINYHTYAVNPAKELTSRGAQAIINISASPFTKYKPESRAKMLMEKAKELNRPIFYANQVGANSELIFDGDSLVIDTKGIIVSRAKRFEESHIQLEYDAKTQSLKTENPFIAETQVPNMIKNMFDGLVLGLRDYLHKSRAAQKVILGLSGGIDSALVCAIAVEALGAQNVIGVTMPSRFSSEGSVSDSQELANNLGVELLEIPIEPIYDAFLHQLEPVFKGAEFNVAEENIQSRSRGDLLMAIANKFGYMVLTTGNKSEIAVGYCTLYGDMAGGLAIIADLYKTEVYAMSEWLNKEYYGKEVIPQATIDKVPSAELRLDQKDTDSLPEYTTLDAILTYYVELQWSRKEILDKGFDAPIVDRILKLVDYNEHKRYQAAPGLKLSTKAFGQGRRWPLVQRWTGHEQ